jgi:hypothetical protein
MRREREKPDEFVGWFRVAGQTVSPMSGYRNADNFTTVIRLDFVGLDLKTLPPGAWAE